MITLLPNSTNGVKTTKKILADSKHKLKSPHPMIPTRIVVHNTANDAPAANEITYMLNNSLEVSYHIAVDDKEIIQAIPFNRNAWHAGDGSKGIGNRQGIGIEICYSKSGSTRFTNAEKNASKLIAYLLKSYGWTTARITKHKDYSGKYCPHRTLDKGWTRFVNMCQTELNKLNSSSNNGNVSTTKPILKQGSTGTKVKELQSLLTKLKYNPGPIDGIFGTKTTNAVKDFQKSKKLVADGIVGPKTWNALLTAKVP